MSRFILLFLSFMASVYGTTNVHFRGQLFCNKPHLQHHLIIWETASLYDHAISRQGFELSQAPHNYAIGATSYASGTSHLYMIIIHNCTPDGSRKKFRVEIGQVSMNGGDVYRHQNIDVNDVGMPTSDIRHFEQDGGNDFY